MQPQELFWYLPQGHSTTWALAALHVQHKELRCTNTISQTQMTGQNQGVCLVGSVVACDNAFESHVTSTMMIKINLR